MTQICWRHYHHLNPRVKTQKQWLELFFSFKTTKFQKDLKKKQRVNEWEKKESVLQQICKNFVSSSRTSSPFNKGLLNLSAVICFSWIFGHWLLFKDLRNFVFWNQLKLGNYCNWFFSTDQTDNSEVKLQCDSKIRLAKTADKDLRICFFTSGDAWKYRSGMGRKIRKAYPGQSISDNSWLEWSVTCLLRIFTSFSNRVTESCWKFDLFYWTIFHRFLHLRRLRENHWCRDSSKLKPSSFFETLNAHFRNCCSIFPSRLRDHVNPKCCSSSHKKLMWIKKTNLVMNQTSFFFHNLMLCKKITLNCETYFYTADLNNPLL